MAAITITYRFMGADVAPNAPFIDYIQWDCATPAFDKDTSQVDVVWSGLATHYYPYTDGMHTPNVTFWTQYRMSVAHTGGPVSNLIAHSLQGDIYANGTTGFVVSATPSDSTNPFGNDNGSGTSAALGPLTSGYVQPFSTVEFDMVGTFTPGGRGIVISTPSVGQWQLQKAAIRPRKEEAL